MNAPRVRRNWCANFQFKRSKVRVRIAQYSGEQAQLGGQPHIILALLWHLRLVN